MRRRNVVLAIALLALVLLIALMPLGMVLPGSEGPEQGLTARRAQDVVWSGWLRDVHLGGVAVGDMHVGLEPLPLLAGQARFKVTSTALSGVLVASFAGTGVQGMTGTLQTAGRLTPLPIGAVALDGFGVSFSGNRCIHAEGVVRASLTGDIGGLALPGGLSGTARCDGPALLLPLAGQSGLERIDLRISGNGEWHAQASIKAGDPALAAKLQASGFTQATTGLSMRFAGRL